MDTGTIITSAVLLACLIVPLGWIYLAGTRRAEAYVRPLRELAAANGHTITDYDTWPDSAIAMDRANRMLYFRNGQNGREMLLKVDLREVARIRSLKVMRSEEGRPSIAQVGLELTYRQRGREPLSIPMYEAGEQFDIGDELLISERWEALVRGLIAEG